MTVWAYEHGNLIYFDGEVWRFKEDDTTIEISKPCPRCGNLPTKEGHDACLGILPYVVHACCGHGRVEGEVILDDEHDGIKLSLEEYYERFGEVGQ